MAKPEILIPGLHYAADETVPKRLVLAVDGLDKHGKTRFALSAPKPLVYLDFDIGKEGVLQKEANFENGILTCKPFAFMPSEIAWEIDDETVRSKKVMEKAEPELTRFRETYLAAVRKPLLKVNGKPLPARTLVIDTGTEAWELLRLCHLGKLTKVMAHHYTEVNSMMRDLVRAAFESHVNVIWLHKLKAEWKDNAEGKGRKTGTLERGGFEGMSYLVQANVIVYRVPANQTEIKTLTWKSGEGLFSIPLDPRGENDLGFRLVVGNSRHDPSLEGLMLSNDQITFRELAQIMLPSTTEADWRDTV